MRFVRGGELYIYIYTEGARERETEEVSERERVHEVCSRGRGEAYMYTSLYRE